MPRLTRIEKSAFRKGEYVGYAGGVWIIQKCGTSYGSWSARHRDNPQVANIFAWRLAELDAKLTQFAEDTKGA